MTNQKVFTYFTLILKPQQLDDDGLVELLATETTRSKIDLARAIRRTPPFIVAELPPHESAACVRRITEAGGEACAPSLVDLQVHGEATLAREITADSHHFGIESWRNKTFLLNPRDLRSIVLCLPQQVERQVRDPRGPGRSNLARASFAAEGTMDQMLTPDNLHTIHRKPESTPVVIDLHFTGSSPRRIVRIDGRKQGWRFLGEARAHSDRVNAAKAANMFRSLAPDATYDDCFGTFNCPASVRMLRISGLPDDVRSFDFYSRWIGHLHRVLRGEAPNI